VRQLVIVDLNVNDASLLDLNLPDAVERNRVTAAVVLLGGAKSFVAGLYLKGIKKGCFKNKSLLNVNIYILNIK